MKIQTSRQFLARLAARRFSRLLKASGANVLAALTVLAALPAAQAANTVYTKADNTTQLDTTGSYTIAGVPDASGTDSIAIGTLTAARTANLGSSLSILGLSVGTSGFAFTEGNSVGAILTLGANGIDMSAATGDLTLASATALGTSEQFNIATGRTLTQSGALSLGSNALTDLSVGTTTFSGFIFGAGGSITKTGAGTLTLSYAGSSTLGNNFTGGITLSAGTLAISGVNAAGTGAITSAATLNVSAAQLLWTGGLTVNAGTTTLSAANSGGTGGITLNTGGTLTATNATALQNNTLTLNGTGTFNPGNGASIGALSGTQGFTVNTGTYILGLNNASPAAYSGNIAGATAANLVKIGFGTQILNGTSAFTGTIVANGVGGTLEIGGQNTANGAVAVQAGTLRLNFNTGATTSNLINPVGLTLSGGALSVVGKNSGTNAIQTFTSTTLAANTASTVSVTNGNSTGTAAVNLNTGLTRNAGSALNVVLPSGTQSATNGVLTTTGTANSILVPSSTGAAYATVGGTDFAAKDASNTLIVPFSSVGTYSTATATSLGGTTQNSDINGTDPTLSAPTTINAIRFSDPNARTLTINATNTLTVSSGGILVSSAVGAPSKITGGNLTAPQTTPGELIVHQFSSQPFTIDSIIVNSGTTALTKTGPGTLIFTQANTYSGTTNLDAGILRMGAGGSIANSQVILSPNDSTSFLDVSTQPTSVGGLSGGSSGGGTSGLAGGLSAGGYVNLGNAGNLTITGTVGSTLTGALVGGVGSVITKTGTNAQSFAGSSQLAFNGTYNLNGGSLGINNGSVNFANTSFAIGSAGTFGPNVSQANVGNFSGSGSITGTASAAAQLFTYGYNGGTAVFSGIVSNGTATPLSVSKFGSGTSTFSGANTYTGSTTVNNGTQVFDYSTGNDVFAATTPGALTLAGGTTIFRGGTGAALNTDTTGFFGLAGNTTTTSGVESRLLLDNNGGAGFTLVLKTTTVNSIATLVNPSTNNVVLFDTSSSAGNVLKTDAAIGAADTNGTVAIRTLGGLLETGNTAVTNFRSNVLIHDSTGYGFATTGAANSIVRYTGATVLNPATDAGTAMTTTTNYVVSGSLARTSQLLFNTLQIDSSSSAVTLTNAVNQRLNDSSGTVQTGRAILVTGTNGATLTGGSGTNQVLYVNNYQTGTTVAGQTFNLDNDTFAPLYVNGIGLVNDTRTPSGDLNVQSGVFRQSLGTGVPAGIGDAQIGGTGVIRLQGGVYEIGGDLNGTTSSTSGGDFSRNTGNAAGQIQLINDSGFSAYTGTGTGTRTVNLGGAATPVTLNWGQDNFLVTTGGTDGNSTFQLGSAYSDATLVFQNGINLNSSNRTINVTKGIGTNAVDAQLTGVIGNTNITSSTFFVPFTQGSLTKAGLGTLELTANNTYNGTTTVNAGTLLIDNTPVAGVGSGTGTGPVVINNGGTLGGTGAIAGGTTVGAGARITGANLGTIGALTLSTVTFSGASGSLATYSVDIGSGTNNSDRLVIGGALNLSGTFDQITFTGSPDGSSNYVLATYASVTGTFDNGSAPAGYSFQYNPTELDLVPTAVPEPATWLGGGLMVGLAAWSQRKRFGSALKA